MKWYRTADGNLRLWYETDEIEQIAEDELRVANLLPTTAAPVTDLERFIEGRLKAQRIGERVGDQRFRQSMSFAVRSRATARAN